MTSDNPRDTKKTECQLTDEQCKYILSRIVGNGLAYYIEAMKQAYEQGREQGVRERTNQLQSLNVSFADLDQIKASIASQKFATEQLKYQVDTLALAVIAADRKRKTEQLRVVREALVRLVSRGK